jgi:hypothetical protein
VTRLAALVVGGEIAAWQSLGFEGADDHFAISDVVVHVRGCSSGLIGWEFEVGRAGHVEIDGIPTDLVESLPERPAASPLSVTSVVGLDHVVVNTDDAGRTCGAIEHVLGLPARRVRDLGNGVTQTFHKAANTVIEVVSGPHITEPGARLWGMVASVADIDALAADVSARLGVDALSIPKPAVQPGRTIATVRASAGIGVPFAFMSPHVPDNRGT